jgi:hypothetical protein
MALTEQKAVEAASVIEQAFAAEEVDELVIDWDHAQVALGLKEPPERPTPDLSSLASLLAPQRGALSAGSALSPPRSSAGSNVVNLRNPASGAMSRRDKAKKKKRKKKK